MSNIKPMRELVSKALETMLTKQCRECGKPFETLECSLAIYVNFCPDCQAVRDKEDNRRIAEEAERRITVRREAWEGEICPLEYRAINPAKLPNPKLLEKVLSWQYGPRGLLLHGDSGRGKTRCAWALLAREHEAGRSVKALDSMAGIRYASKFSVSAEAVEDWIEDLIRAQILFLDDIFKVKLTDSFEGAIFSLVDQRIQKQKPTILTSNDTGDTLESRMSADRAKPLLRRLREHCQQINC